MDTNKLRTAMRKAVSFWTNAGESYPMGEAISPLQQQISDVLNETLMNLGCTIVRVSDSDSPSRKRKSADADDTVNELFVALEAAGLNPSPSDFGKNALTVDLGWERGAGATSSFGVRADVKRTMHIAPTGGNRFTLRGDDAKVLLTGATADTLVEFLLMTRDAIVVKSVAPLVELRDLLHDYEVQEVMRPDASKIHMLRVFLKDPVMVEVTQSPILDSGRLVLRVFGDSWKVSSATTTVFPSAAQCRDAIRRLRDGDDALTLIEKQERRFTDSKVVDALKNALGTLTPSGRAVVLFVASNDATGLDTKTMSPQVKPVVVPNSPFVVSLLADQSAVTHLKQLAPTLYPDRIMKFDVEVAAESYALVRCMWTMPSPVPMDVGFEELFS